MQVLLFQNYSEYFKLFRVVRVGLFNEESKNTMYPQKTAGFKIISLSANTAA
jgi:hypothetical protein